MKKVIRFTKVAFKKLLTFDFNLPFDNKLKLLVKLIFHYLIGDIPGIMW